MERDRIESANIATTLRGTIMNTWGWVEDATGGSLVQNPMISAFDSGFTLGYGIFETMKTRNNAIQFVDFHLDRLATTANTLKLEVPERPKIEAAMRHVVEANNPDDYGRLRLSLTHGIQGLTSWSLVITWQPIELWNKPARLTLSNVKQSEHRLSRSMKTLSYLENAFALQVALTQGFDDAILFDSSMNITETALANLFIVRGEEVVTPKASSGCLIGVTRDIILTKLSHQFVIQEGDISVSDVESADEVFITSAIRDIQPVECVDSWHYTAPGAVTAELQKIYHSFAEGGYQ